MITLILITGAHFEPNRADKAHTVQTKRDTQRNLGEKLEPSSEPSPDHLNIPLAKVRCER